MVDSNSPSNQEESAGSDESRRLSTIFSILSNEDRRIALHVMRDRQGELLGIRDLAEEMAAAQPSDETVEPLEVETTLRHAHCPKLADAGVIEYDEQSGTVRSEGDPLLDSGLLIAKNADVE